MKILFVGENLGNYGYYLEFLTELHSHGHQVSFLYDKKLTRKNHIDLPEFFNEFSPKSLYSRNVFIRFWGYGTRELLNYSWYCRRSDQSRYYRERIADRFGIILSWLLKSSFAVFLLRQDFSFSILMWIVNSVPVSTTLRQQLRKLSPDVVVVCPGNLRFSHQVDYLYTAKALKIPAISMVLSWDNTSNKGLFIGDPDLIFGWNKTHFHELTTLHKISSSKIRLIGALQFQKWLALSIKSQSLHSTTAGPDQSRLKVKHCSRQYTILYLGSSLRIAPDERNVLCELSGLISKYNLNARVLFKPHPAHSDDYRDINESTSEDQFLHVSLVNKELGFTFSNSDCEEFQTLAESADLITGLNTSAFFDCMALGLVPVPLIRNEYHMTQSSSTHFKKLLSENLLPVANSCAQLLEIMQLPYNEKIKFFEPFLRNQDDFFDFNTNLLPSTRARRALEEYVEQHKIYFDH